MQRTNISSITSAMGLGGLSGAMLAQQNTSGFSTNTLSAIDQQEKDDCDVQDFLVGMYDELKTHPEQVTFDTAAEGQKKRLLSKKTVEVINTVTVKY